ncbi:protein FAR1-RELATED SEQUENCE 5-like [Sesbania bispinosa]|nr:protein FAR1-RELATED SEQUENCE 5-like [Sesbania bispinosa]
MMEDKDNRVNEGADEDVNNLKSPNEENACSGEVVSDLYKRISELTNDDIRLLEFDSNYTMHVNSIAGERSEKHLNRRDRIREAKAITCTQCLATLRLYIDNNSRKWRVGMFEPQRNHDLAPANMKGGHSDLGFCKKDLYNHTDKENRAKIEDGDAFAALCYLQVKLCSWNLHQNACENVKNPKFLEDFKMLINANFIPEKFEQEWLNKFFEVRKEIEKVAALNMIERSEVGNVVTMKMNKFGSPGSLYVVLFYKTIGDTSKKEVLRSGVVGAACNRLNKAAHKNSHNFVNNIEAIHHLADQMERQLRWC